MMNCKVIALAVAVLALSNYAVATGINLHHKKEAEVSISGARQEVSVSGARSIEEKKTKHDALKEALGLGGPVVASSIPSGCKSAFGIVKDNPDFTFLKNAIVATGLQSVLDDPALVATVFAPSDEAFSKALDALDISPQELFNDVVTLTLVLKYHVIPGLSLEFENLKDSQPYFTLLSDKYKNKYTVEFDAKKEIDLKELKLEGSLDEATTRLYAIIPSGGPPAKITKFDINAGCPTVVHVINNVLIPDYKDAILADAGNVAIDIAAAYQEAGAPLPTLPGVAKP